MIEKWWKFLTNGNLDSVLSLNDSYHFKAFDCIDHHLLIEKPNAYRHKFSILLSNNLTLLK